MTFYLSNQDAMALLIGDRLTEEHISERYNRLEKAPRKITYEITDDVALLHQYFLLRGASQDAFDQTSHIAVARMGRQCVAACRMTLSKDSRTPCEKQFDLLDAMPELANETYMEISRPAMLPEFQEVVLVELMRMLLERGAEMGARHAVTIAPVPLAQRYRSAAELFGLRWAIHNDEVPAGDYEANLALYTLDFAPVTATQDVRVKNHSLQSAE